MAASSEELKLVGGILSAGGTQLGLVHDIRLIPTDRVEDVLAEEYGGEATETVFLGREWAIACLLRNYDADALNARFGPSAVGGVLADPGSFTAGALMTSTAKTYTFTPNDPANPAITLYFAAPDGTRSGELPFDGRDELSYLAVFRGYREAAGGSDRVVRVG